MKVADDAPPMIEEDEQAEPAMTWWAELRDTDRDDWGSHVGRTFQIDGPGDQRMTVTRREADIARAAYAQHLKQVR